MPAAHGLPNQPCAGGVGGGAYTGAQERGAQGQESPDAQEGSEGRRKEGTGPSSQGQSGAEPSPS